MFCAWVRQAFVLLLCFIKTVCPLILFIHSVNLGLSLIKAFSNFIMKFVLGFATLVRVRQKSCWLLQITRFIAINKRNSGSFEQIFESLGGFVFSPQKVGYGAELINSM